MPRTSLPVVIGRARRVDRAAATARATDQPPATTDTAGTAATARATATADTAATARATDTARAHAGPPARGATAGPRIVLSGHLDVVPPGDPAHLDGRPVGRRGPRRLALRPRRLRHEGRRGRDPGRRPGARRRPATSSASPASSSSRSSRPRRTAGRARSPRSGPASRGDMAVITEPSNLDVVVAHAGAITFRLTVPGPRGPCLAAARGRLGARQAVRAHAGAEADEARRNAAETDPLMTPRPAVPDDRRHRRGRRVGLDRARPGHRRRRYGVRLGQSAAEAEAELRACIAAACAADEFLRDHPATVEITGGRFGSARVPSDHPLPVGLADAAEAVTGRRPALLGEPYGADMQLFVNVGDTPCVIFGPGDVKVAHSADEHVPLDEVETCARVLLTWVRRELIPAARVSRPAAMTLRRRLSSEPGRDDDQGGAEQTQGRVAGRRDDHARGQAGGRRRTPDERVGQALRGASARPAEAGRQQRRPRDVAEAPAVPEQEQGERAAGRRRPAAPAPTRTADPARIARPAMMTRWLPNRSVSRPETGDSANIPNDVGADDDARPPSRPWPCSRHVERGHRHDQDHHDLAGDERDHRDRDVRSAQEPLERRRPVAELAASRVSDVSASSYGSGRSSTNVTGRGAGPTNRIGIR